MGLAKGKGRDSSNREFSLRFGAPRNETANTVPLQGIFSDFRGFLSFRTAFEPQFA